jgi:hypothetical protein
VHPIVEIVFQQSVNHQLCYYLTRRGQWNPCSDPSYLYASCRIDTKLIKVRRAICYHFKCMQYKSK